MAGNMTSHNGTALPDIPLLAAKLAFVYGGILLGVPIVISANFSRDGKWNKRRQWSYNVGFGLLTVIMFYLNFQFFPWNDQVRVFEFVIAIFDVPYNIFFSGASPQHLAEMDGHDFVRCNDPLNGKYMPANVSCSPIKGSFNLGYHSGLGVAFMDDYVYSPAAKLKRAMLLFHILGQTISLGLCYLQLHKPMRTKFLWLHRYSGRVCVVTGIIGSVSGGILGGYHYFDKVPAYGNVPNAMGVQFCMVLTCTCLYKAVRAVIAKDIPSHKLWMMRYAGAMWGIFLIFRLMFLIIGPIFTLMKLHPGSIYNLVSWTSGPIGIVIANYVHAKVLREEAAAKKEKLDIQEDFSSEDDIPLLDQKQAPCLIG